MHHIDGSHDDVIPRTNVDSEAETQEELEKEFRQKNWWARNENLLILIPMLYLILVASLSAKPVLFASPERAQDIFAGFIGLLVGGFIMVLLIMCAIKHFLIDRPYLKFCEEWNIRNGTWASDVGGILKIYD